jgi:hypothetical protein
MKMKVVKVQITKLSGVKDVWAIKIIGEVEGVMMPMESLEASFYSETEPKVEVIK